jgi:2-amino-4-hydroxy-6-hydroxymethyldihydropteridine diphosphokinase
MATIYLALGSNVGDSKQHIEQAIERLGAVVNNIRRAPLYRSKAIGYTDQADFLNTAVSGETDLTPEKLLEFIKTVEQKIGRVERFHWGPREIDIDIIFYDNLRQETKLLTLPHPEFRKRDFVLTPLKDLNPDLIDPVTCSTVSQLLEKITPDHKSIVDETG